MAKVSLDNIIRKPDKINPKKPAKCMGCPAYDAPGPVWSTWPAEGEPLLGFVGEAPGEQEVRQGMGFVGPSGGLLWYMAGKNNIRRGQCYIANAAKCITKAEGAFRFCADTWLKDELKLLPPDMPIIALGNEAKNVLIPEWQQFGIMTTRGCRKGRIMTALHPAYIRRQVRFVGENSGGDKQDFSPTLEFDIVEALNHRPPSELVYVEGLPPLEHSYEFMSCDLETNALDSHQPEFKITEIGFGVAPGRVYRESYTDLHRDQYQRLLNSTAVVFHNMAFDVLCLRDRGYTVKDPHCSMLAAHLLNPDLPLGLDFQNTLYVHYPPWKKRARRGMQEYHGTDLDVTQQLWNRQLNELKEHNLLHLYEKEVRPVTLRCIDMKQKGIKVDRDRAFKVNVGLGLQMQRIDAALSKAAPGVDFGSPQQVGIYLYDFLKLPEKRHAKTGRRTTDVDALEELTEETGHPVLKLLMARRGLAKMRDTYTTYLLDEDQFYHHDISFTAATGRARGFLLTIQKGPMRSLFIPDEPGWKFLYADWEQIELWISAIASGDKNMQKVLSEVSLHAYGAAKCFGGEMSKKHPRYHETKFINHGYNFGRGERSIASAHEIPLALVQQYTRWFHSEFPRWAEWRKEQLKCAQENGSVTNPFGFTRYMWSGNIKGMAYSFTPQSSPAHMMKRTILSLWDDLPKPARIVLPVHDALLIAYPEEMEKEVVDCTMTHMTQPWPELGGFRARCEIGFGYNWQEASG